MSLRPRIHRLRPAIRFAHSGAGLEGQKIKAPAAVIAGGCFFSSKVVNHDKVHCLEWFCMINQNGKKRQPELLGLVLTINSNLGYSYGSEPTVSKMVMWTSQRRLVWTFMGSSVEVPGFWPTTIFAGEVLLFEPMKVSGLAPWFGWYHYYSPSACFTGSNKESKPPFFCLDRYEDHGNHEPTFNEKINPLEPTRWCVFVFEFGSYEQLAPQLKHESCTHHPSTNSTWIRCSIMITVTAVKHVDEKYIVVRVESSWS